MFALNSGAGCGLGMTFLKQLPSIPNLTGTTTDINTRLYIASMHVNSGSLFTARRSFHELATTIPRVGRAISREYAKYVRMTALANADQRAATEAIRIAEDSDDKLYHYRTGRFALASAYEHQGDYPAARAQADDLTAHFAHGEPSWWHRIEHECLLGRTIILCERSPTCNQSIRVALKHIIQAQYAAAFLDFRGLPIPDYRKTNGASDLTNRLSPTDLVTWASLRYGLSKEQLSEIRREAILGRSMPKDHNERTPSDFQKRILAAVFTEVPTA